MIAVSADRPAKLRQSLEEKGLGDVLITGGGIIPAEEMEELRESGVGRLFGPGTPTSEAIEYVKSWFDENRRDATL